MQVKDIMTPNPMCAEPSTPLQRVAQMMIECDCGGLPVCQPGSRRLAGFVTDRDIVCRILAQGLNPLERTAQDAMTRDMRTVRPDTSLDECIRLMEEFKIRRVPVTNEQGEVIGIVSQADLIRRAVAREPDLVEEIEEALEEISEPRAAV
ncbi:MAG: CBS domain-containing protein [Armatimonadetes bacterium]|nr:CBS domain-containing protein [Armatimonadota bacterium]